MISNILIITEEYDFSTPKVIDWLMCFQKNIHRYNAIAMGKSSKQYFKESIFISNETKNITSGLLFNNTISKNVDSIYYRRATGYSNGYLSKRLIIPNSLNIIRKEIKNKNKLYTEIYKDYLISKIQSNTSRILGCYGGKNVNKIQVLDMASICGLKVPDTLISDSVDIVKNFYKNHNNKIICKPIEEIIHCKKEKKIYKSLTKVVNFEDIQNGFGITLFQEYIEKSFEVRTFFINDQMFSIAMFSQNNPKTKIDFRNYDETNPNRRVPYNLPEEIHQKIIVLMNKLKLNIGSIDFIISTRGEHVFLEVNPVGQYGFVDYAGGYNLDYEIAKFLANEL